MILIGGDIMIDSNKIFQCNNCRKTLSIKENSVKGCNCLPEGQTCHNCTSYDNCLRNRLAFAKQTYCRYSETKFAIKCITL